MKNHKEEDLKKILGMMQDKELEQLPDKETLQKTYELSDSFYGRMSQLQKRMARKKKFRKHCSAAAAVAAAFVLVFLVVHPAAEIAPMYTLEYVPDGYELESDYFYENIGVISYFDGENYLRFSYCISDAGIQLGGEGAGFSILKQDGKQIYYFKSTDKDVQSGMEWLSDNERVAFGISGHLSKEEMLKVMKGVKEK